MVKQKPKQVAQLMQKQKQVIDEPELFDGNLIDGDNNNESSDNDDSIKGSHFNDSEEERDIQITIM